MVYAQGQKSVHQLADANIPTAPVPKEPSKNKGTKHREMAAAAWLKRYARMIGDQLLFGDSHSETENLLPFGNKRMVYEAYNQSINEISQSYLIHAAMMSSLVCGKIDRTLNM